MILLGFFGAIAIVLGVIALIIGAFFAVLYIMTLYLFILPIMMVEGPEYRKHYKTGHSGLPTKISGQISDGLRYF